MRRTVIAGALGNCVHVAGVSNFLGVAEAVGYRTVFLGAAASVEQFVEAVRAHDPEIVGVSYRLTPEVAGTLVERLMTALESADLANRRFLFGGTPPVCRVVEQTGWFERCFTGLESPDAVWACLKGGTAALADNNHGDTLVERLNEKAPYPLLRHHFGLPSLEETVEGVAEIAKSGVLDIVSLAPDQNAQESFFRPEEMDRSLDGAGGAPVRTAEHLRMIQRAALQGNYPLLRIYSGTRDLLQWAELSVNAINNAWAAVPLCWYSALDGRSRRALAEAIAENQSCMRWYGERGIPVEVNEAHHWSLRDAHDTIAVVMAYLAAYNAKVMGVRRYISQLMFNTPPGLYPQMDLAKALAQTEMVESLHGPDFFSLREVRAGLLHLSPRLNVAKGQLAASTMLALALKPHIIHVVGYCEGDHAASPEDVIESCEIVQGVLGNSLFGMPDMVSDRVVQERKRELMCEAERVLDAVRSLALPGEDAFASPRVLSRAIALGILDAPHLSGNPNAAGRLRTRALNGAVYALDRSSDEIVSEDIRLSQIPGGQDHSLRGLRHTGGAL